MIKWLKDISNEEFELVGGKAYNLGVMLQAGMMVPDAFVITSDAYKAYISENGISREIERILEANDSSQEIEKKIKALFSANLLSQALKEDIARFQKTLTGKSLAVRSSATAEDLPGMSFAGQYSSYLNVAPSNLNATVIECWKSLWNERAIEYRKNNRVNDDFSHCVIVQEMIEAAVSGVVFTANPISGLRNELCINASFGLGEAIVSGEVVPDQYIVNKKTGEIVSEEINEKITYCHYSSAGTTYSALPKDKRFQACLSKEMIAELLHEAIKVEAFFGKPQDIEFSIDEKDSIYILQSRDITTLYPIDTFTQDGKLRAYLVASNVMLAVREAWTPLGANLYGGMFPSMLNFMLQLKNKLTDSFVKYDGNRILVDITYLLSSGFMAKQIGNMFSGNDLPLKATMNHIVEKYGKQFKSQGIRFKIPWSAIKYAFKIIPYMKEAKKFAPEERPVQMKKLGEYFYQERLKTSQQLNTLEEKWEFAKETMESVFALTQRQAFYAVETSAFPSIEKTIRKKFGDKYDLDILGYALPNCITVEIGMELNRLAQFFDENSLEPTCEHPKVKEFLHKYGYRGDIELDFGTPRWKEDPEFIINQIKSYMVDKMYERNLKDHENKAKAANDLIDEIYRATKEKSGEKAARKLANSMRGYRIAAGMREYPKFNIVQGLDIARKVILDEGEKMVTQGVLECSHDIFFLNKDQLLMKDQRNFKTYVAEAKETYNKEMKRIRIPRVVFNTGETFYSGHQVDLNSETLQGIPLSAGTYEGIVRVVRDPRKSGLKEGEILVTETTNPAWTPLFATAKGLILEHGGPLSHGGIVAREYGIPAVVGIPTATEILKDGQRVRINGESGTVQII